MAAFHSFVHRLLTTPLTPESYVKELGVIKFLASQNGYSPDIIDKLISVKRHRLLLNSIYILKPSPDNNDGWIVLPHVTELSLIPIQYFKNLNFRTLAVNKINLGRLLTNNKAPKDRATLSGVYEVECSTCNIKYIGQSGRAFETRIKEHSAAIRLKNVGVSAFSDHCLEFGHHFDGSFRILHSVRKGRLLSLLEGFEIWKSSRLGPICNDQQDILRTPLLAVNFRLSNLK